MPALFAIVVMFGVAIHPAIDVETQQLHVDKLKIEHVYKLND